MFFPAKNNACWTHDFDFIPTSPNLIQLSDFNCCQFSDDTCSKFHLECSKFQIVHLLLKKLRWKRDSSDRIWWSTNLFYSCTNGWKRTAQSLGITNRFSCSFRYGLPDSDKLATEHYCSKGSVKRRTTNMMGLFPT